MLKQKGLIDFFKQFLFIALLGGVLHGCGSGGGKENILCGGQPCTSPEAETGTEEIDDIVGQGSPDSIQYVSADPAELSIRTAGGDETSIITFMVTDTAGDPIEGVSVSFSLDNTVGGVSLSNVSDDTNASGEASVIVQSGTTHTTVSVTATIDATQESTISPSLTISTGVPDFDSFSFALDMFNPNAYRLDGEEVTATVRMADFYNNPPPDGTKVSFYTEGGRIASSCTSEKGNCTAVWTGQNPRAKEGDGDRLGRSAVLAVVTGAESFVDVNSNGIFDDADIFTEEHDQPEPWLDKNENGFYDQGEYYVDFNNNNMWDTADGEYNGPLCDHSSLCSTSKTIALFAHHKIVMASHVFQFSSSALDVDNSDGVLNIGSGRSYSVTIADENGNSIPGGSSITAVTTNGKVVSGAVVDILTTQYDPVTYSIGLSPDDTPSDDGVLTITVSIAGVNTVVGTFNVSDM